ncbi:3-oxoacid CoA-transferase subunit B [Enterococcus sp. AZ109]|uniref:3-oxoacid CoA-transferase subunit B n=1 Tax=Enterococcus sp. AZ109 TaxID=2774634 RepID=UPI003F282E9E
MDAKRTIAQRAAKELHNGDVVNLGIGLPTKIVEYIPQNTHVWLQSENGMLGMGSLVSNTDNSCDVVNAGGQPVSLEAGACFFDSSISFGIIRGGHVDVSILGALEVDKDGNLANHIIPGKMVPGMGGAMDLVQGSKRVIVVTTHTAKNNKPKIVEKLSLPATAIGKVDLIITEMAVLKVTTEGLVLQEILGNYTFEEIQQLTDTELLVNNALKVGA